MEEKELEFFYNLEARVTDEELRIYEIHVNILIEYIMWLKSNSENAGISIDDLMTELKERIERWYTLVTFEEKVFRDIVYKLIIGRTLLCQMTTDPSEFRVYMHPERKKRYDALLFHPLMLDKHIASDFLWCKMYLCDLQKNLFSEI